MGIYFVCMSSRAHTPQKCNHLSRKPSFQTRSFRFQAFPRFVDNNALLTSIRGLRVDEFYKKIECPEVQIKRMFAMPVIRQLAQRSQLAEHRVLQQKVLVIKISLSPYNCCSSRCTIEGEIAQNRTPVRP